MFRFSQWIKQKKIIGSILRKKKLGRARKELALSKTKGTRSRSGTDRAKFAQLTCYHHPESPSNIHSKKKSSKRFAANSAEFPYLLVLVGPRNARQGLAKTQNVFVVATKPPEAIKKHVPQVKPPAERRTSGEPGDCRGASRGRENCRYRMGKYVNLVGGLEHFFPYIGNVIIPTDFHIFHRGRSTTNQK
jgi:hypothetical protein